MGAFESGQAFIAGVLAKLPTEQQAQAKAIFDAAEAKDAVILMGDGALARADYSKSMDALREKEGALNEHYERLNNWYAINKDALDEAKTLKEKGALITPAPEPAPDDGKRTPAPAPTAALSAEDVRRLADEAVNSA